MYQQANTHSPFCFYKTVKLSINHRSYVLHKFRPALCGIEYKVVNKCIQTNTMWKKVWTTPNHIVAFKFYGNRSNTSI